MTIPRGAWPRLKEAFEGARVLALDARQAYLAAACDGDDALRQEVEALLVSHDRATTFLETPAVLVDGSRASSLEGHAVGTYEILARIGIGGMGEVYRARDTKLNRLVAIKVLLPAVADEPDRLARFSREAQLLASLNHPHIAQIHGLEEVGGVRALVMELVEGPTLADRIAQGAIPLDEALPMAAQIAEALEAAHGQGIIHRDLKPANIKVREDGTVKVLDFGLAKAIDPTSSAGVDAVSSPAPGVLATGIDVIIGTAAYMSPEQARGRPVDKRADLWAFGAVLYEMVTGRRAFGGEHVSDTLTRVLTEDPDWSALPAGTPAPVRRLLRRCLEKDRKRRLDSAADARLEIDEAIASPHGETLALAAAPSRRVTAVTVSALAGAASLAVFVTMLVTRAPVEAPRLPSRFVIVAPADQPLNVSGPDRDLALSRDGRHLVYRYGGSNSTGSPLMVRAMDQLAGRPLTNVAYAYAPFFSPDGRWVGFFETGSIKKVALLGGVPVTLGPVTGASLGASWGDDNTIVFATDDPATGLWGISADGGPPRMLTRPDSSGQEGDHAFPCVVPGAAAVLFTIAQSGRPDDARVAVLDLRTGRWKAITRGSQAEYVTPERSGDQAYLVYVADSVLHGIQFDPVRLEAIGQPVRLDERVMVKSRGAANYVLSRPGSLVYVPHGTHTETARPRLLVWVDRTGHEEPIDAPLRPYGIPRLSPDGTQVALDVADTNVDTSVDIWIWDGIRRQLKRLTFDPGVDSMPVWAPDSRRIVFMSNRSGALNLYSQATDGTGAVARLTTSDTHQWPTTIAPDGTRLAGFDLLGTFVLRWSPGGTWSIESRFGGVRAEVSPNGRYVAYEARESGRNEVYVRPFPLVDSGRWQISTGGATRPAWARNGRELFFVDATNTLTAVSVSTTGTTFSAGHPQRVFDTRYPQPNPSRHYDVSPDGKRFLMLKDAPVDNAQATGVGMVVVLNWFEELKQRVATSGQ